MIVGRACAENDPPKPDFVSLINIETLIAKDHPIRSIKRMCDEVLAGMSQHFDEIYATDGAPSIPPETLLKGKVLQALYTVRSDRQLCARMQTDLMFRWFVDLPLDQEVFDASTYSKNQQRLLTHEVADLFVQRNGCVIRAVYSKSNASAPAPSATLAQAVAEVDFLITGLGD